ncbi:hypothetical protein GGX14DRAFT_579463 [Mycena pura]|uniref:Uncharacterized protein n=1 Tax=Mycena pura TaxID=153505 RepID=A0AAD6UPF4_9AGAR|nr:hypothetical protein GGX14DRAFT_579463 [Mycena pura]
MTSSSQGISASTIPRMYHSSATLTPNGSILLAGSNLNRDITIGVQFYSPAYLCKPRPTYNRLPATVNYNSKFTLTGELLANTNDVTVTITCQHCAITALVVPSCPPPKPPAAYPAHRPPPAPPPAASDRRLHYPPTAAACRPPPTPPTDRRRPAPAAPPRTAYPATRSTAACPTARPARAPAEEWEGGGRSAGQAGGGQRGSTVIARLSAWWRASIPGLEDSALRPPVVTPDYAYGGLAYGT